MLKENKFHFVVCYNNEQYMQECTKYISFLEVPDGIETEIIGVTGAEGMAAGYQAAMEESDAKYKVYLHQDVFILNRHFIQDVLGVFRENPEYGMLGVIGSSAFVEDANYWCQWDVGMTDCCNSLRAMHLALKNPEDIQSVFAIDGMIMVTCHDIPWREDIIKGFDFYDISQSMEFQKAGYKVGVPHQEAAWCIHDCGQSKLDGYDGYRKKFCQEYRYCGYQYRENKMQCQRVMRNQKVEELLPFLEETLKSGQLEKAKALIDKTMEFYVENTGLCTLYVLSKAMLQEKVLQKGKKLFCERMGLQEMKERLLLYKFLLRRLEYDKPIEGLQDVVEWIGEKEDEALAVAQMIASHSVVNVPKVIWELVWFLENREKKKWKLNRENYHFTVPNQKDILAVSKLYKELQAEFEKLSGEDLEKEDDFAISSMASICYMVEKINTAIYIVGWEEKFYKAYADVVFGKKDIKEIVSITQGWLEQIESYLKKEKEPLVSVLVPVYNGADFFEDTLQSIVKQSYKNLQIIAIDDCSEDHSREIIDNMAEDDGRIEKVYLEKNANLCVASNLGYKRTRGKYIAIIGHDDIWKKDKIEKQLHFMEMNEGYAACFTLCDTIDDAKQFCNEKCVSLYQTFQQPNRTQKEWVKTLFFGENVLCAPSAFIRKQCLKENSFYQYGLLQLQDYALWMDLLIDYPCYVMQEKLTLYRQFLKKKNNLSTFDKSKGNRLCHENSYIQKRLLENLEDEKFGFYFREYFLKQDAHTPEELQCERAFLLMKMQNCHCIDLFMELFEDDGIRGVLEDVYHFCLNDFYGLNAKPFPYNCG